MVTLSRLYRLNILSSFEQTFGSSSIEPSHAASHKLHRKLSSIQIGVVYACNLKLAPLARLDLGGNFRYVAIIEIKSWDRIFRFRVFRLFLYTKNVARVIKLNHAESARVLNGVAKYNGATVLFNFCLSFK